MFEEHGEAAKRVVLIIIPEGILLLLGTSLALGLHVFFRGILTNFKAVDGGIRAFETSGHG